MEAPNRVVFLRGLKTVLRPVQESDVELFVRWMNDPEVRRYLKRFRPITVSEEREWVADIAKRPNDIIFVIETLDGTPIGTMGLHRIKWIDGVATTGSAIGERAYWNCGYGTDAKMTLLQYAFLTLGLRKICSAAYAFNRRSVAYSLKCGYRMEAVLKRHVFRHGRLHSLVLLAVYRLPWERARRRYLKRMKRAR